MGITFTIQFFQVQPGAIMAPAAGATGLESPKFLASAEHLCWIRFRRSAELSGFPLFCVNLLVHDLSFALQY